MTYEVVVYSTIDGSAASWDLWKTFASYEEAQKYAESIDEKLKNSNEQTFILAD